MGIKDILPSGKKSNAGETLDGPQPDGGQSPAQKQSFPSNILPSVLAIPKSRITLLQRKKAVRRSFLIAMLTVGVLMVALGGLYFLLTVAEREQAQAEANRDYVQSEATRLAPVADLYFGFEERQRAIANVLSTDINYYTLIETISNAVTAEIPIEALTEDTEGNVYVKDDYSHIQLRSFDVRLGSPCPSPDFDPEPALGCISGSATSSSYATAGEVITALNDSDNGMFSGYILSVSEGTGSGGVGATTWNFTINFGSTALTGKYAEESRRILGGADPAPPVNPEDGDAPPSPEPTVEGENN